MFWLLAVSAPPPKPTVSGIVAVPPAGVATGPAGELILLMAAMLPALPAGTTPGAVSTRKNCTSAVAGRPGVVAPVIAPSHHPPVTPSHSFPLPTPAPPPPTPPPP